MLCTLVLVSLADPTVKVAIPDQHVEVRIDLKDFEADEGAKGGRTLLRGHVAGRGTISLLYEANAPFVSGEECARRWKGATTFSVDGVACVETKEKLGKTSYEMTTFHAYPVNADYLFDIHASVTSPGAGKQPSFSREDFVAAVKSFQVAGRPDPETLEFPAAFYAFRDEAAQHADGQLEWVKAQAASRKDEAYVHLYAACLAKQRESEELAESEFALAADLLAQQHSRNAKEDLALFRALDGLGAAHASRKEWAKAVPYLERLLEVATKSGRKDAKAYRSTALYELAICGAQTSDKAKAIARLRQAIELDPSLKERAAGDELLKALRSEPEFKKLTKG